MQVTEAKELDRKKDFLLCVRQFYLKVEKELRANSHPFVTYPSKFGSQRKFASCHCHRPVSEPVLIQLG